MVEESNSMENGILNTWVDVVDASLLKKEIREINKLPETGLVIKKIHKSALTISYEEVKGGFAEFLEMKLKICPNIPNFLIKAREKLC